MISDGQNKAQRCDVILVAGGSSQRYGETMPKQFDMVHGRPLYLWSLDVFLNWSKTENVVLVSPESWVEPLRESLQLVMKHNSDNAIHVVAGGVSRQMSAARGMKVLNEISSQEWVMIHDAARPAITEALLDRLWVTALANGRDEQVGGVVPGIPAGETIKSTVSRGDQILVEETLPRSSLRIIQTPQILKRTLLSEAYGKFDGLQAVDDACLLEKMGLKIIVVDGDNDNIKVTFSEDKERVSNWLRKRYPQV